MRRLLAGFDRRAPASASTSPDEPLTVFDELDELYWQRDVRGDPRWFPGGGGPELARLARERRAAPALAVSARPR
jgi:hypothetical protein